MADRNIGVYGGTNYRWSCDCGSGGGHFRTKTEAKKAAAAHNCLSNKCEICGRPVSEDWVGEGWRPCEICGPWLQSLIWEDQNLGPREREFSEKRIGRFLSFVNREEPVVR